MTTAAATLVDGHVHVWDPRMLRYPWLDSVPGLDRPVPPPSADAGTGVAAVFVEADRLPRQAVDEVRLVEGLDWPGLAAIVAYAPVHLGGGVSAALEQLRDGHPLVTGVRRLLQDEPDGAIEAHALVAGLRAVAAAGLAFDATVRPHQLEELARAHDAAGELTLVLDHLGNPPTGDGLGSPAGQAWLRGIAAVARHPLAVVKLSGAALGKARGIAFARAALEAFGPRRTLLGSDAPLSVGSDAVAYGAWADSAGTGLGLDAVELAGVRRGTAARVYRIALETLAPLPAPAPWAVPAASAAASSPAFPLDPSETEPSR